MKIRGYTTLCMKIRGIKLLSQKNKLYMILLHTTSCLSHTSSATSANIARLETVDPEGPGVTSSHLVESCGSGEARSSVSSITPSTHSH